MQLPDFTVEHLQQLPLRAIVAFASRSARRVEHLAHRPEGDPEREGRQVAIEAALRTAEDFAAGANVPPDDSAVAAIDAIRMAKWDTPSSQSAVASVAEAVHAAASAWHALESRKLEGYRPLGGTTPDARHLVGAIEHAAVDLAALSAFTAVVEAFNAVGSSNEAFVAASLNDYNKLLCLNLGRYPEPGGSIDPSPGGPLGIL
jgi:hypothetical protein